MVARKKPKEGFPNEFPSNADGDSTTSIAIAQGTFDQIQSKAKLGSRLASQISGGNFEQITQDFVEKTLGTLRPSKWHFNPDKSTILRSEGYCRLAELLRTVATNPGIAALLGSEHIIAPDIFIVREPEYDQMINTEQILVGTVARHSGVHESKSKAALHASICCKWRLAGAQNGRSEALSLIRNRKGRVPHIAVVTAEPLPSRLASVVLGTRDIDCVYHFALPELVKSIAKLRLEDSIRLLKIMVDGGRLKDISELPSVLAM